jgi:glucuronate isomerase
MEEGKSPSGRYRNSYEAVYGRRFLLAAKTGRQLYHEAAADEPVFDYRCHLYPRG